MSRLDDTILVEVSGKGAFPTDMLRHDCAWPADTTSALDILRLDRRTLRVFVSKRRFFQPARWNSFGWAANEVPGQ